MILPIARMGHPVLQKPAEKVEDIASATVQNFIADLTETFYALRGVGLAAPQVFHAKRIVIFEVNQELAEQRRVEQVPLTVLINPVVEPLTMETQLGWEACFSVPGLMGEVPRYRAIRYSGFSPTGEPIVREVEGYHARVVQHECDHLDGILYPARLLNILKFGYVEEIRASIQS